MRRPASKLGCVALSIWLVTACADDSPEGVSVGDSGSDGGGPSADGGDRAGSDAGPEAGDTERDVPSGVANCTAEANVETVATAAAASIAADAERGGNEPLPVRRQTLTSHTVAEADRLRQERAEAPLYFATEADLLALPEGDRLRRAWLDGDVHPPDWATEGLLVALELTPYTDTFLYQRGSELLVVALRLEACPADRLIPEPPPREFVRRSIYTVPAVETVSHRVETRWFALAAFETDHAWVRSEANPLIRRRGAGAAVAHVEGTDVLWINGYSAATGRVFRATAAAAPGHLDRRTVLGGCATAPGRRSG